MTHSVHDRHCLLSGSQSVWGDYGAGATAARLGTTAAGQGATSTVSVGRATPAAATPGPPLVQERADHHPGGGFRAGVPARPGGVGSQATDPNCQHSCSPGSFDTTAAPADGGSDHCRAYNNDPTDDGAASNDSTAYDGPSRCDDAPADNICSPASNHGRTVAVRSAGQPIRLQLLWAWRAHHQSTSRYLPLLRVHPQLR
jgi:hypothetical protein